MKVTATAIAATETAMAGHSGRLATKRVAKAGDLVAERLRPGRYVLRIPGRGPTTAFVLR